MGSKSRVSLRAKRPGSDIWKIQCNLWIGIDSGKTGALTWLWETKAGPLYIEVFKMPGTDKDLWELFEKNGLQNLRRACLELITARPAPRQVKNKQGKKIWLPGRGSIASAVLCTNYGALRMALTGRRIPFEIVSAGKWKRAMGVLGKKGMKDSEKHRIQKEKAQQLFPNVKGITNATAASVLLAEYARRTYR